MTMLPKKAASPQLCPKAFRPFVSGGDGPPAGGKRPGAAPQSKTETGTRTLRTFALPPAAGNQRRVFGYLLGTRQIDRAVLSAFVRKGLIYEDLPYHNAVFVGLDAAGVPRHAHKRSTNSEGKSFRLNVEGSDPAHSFHWVGTSRQLYVFEAPIDLLSYITLHRRVGSGTAM